MSNTTKTRTLGIVIVLVAAAAVITGIYAATMTQSAFAAKGDPGKDKKDPADFKCTGENTGDGNTIAFICQDNHGGNDISKKLKSASIIT